MVHGYAGGDNAPPKLMLQDAFVQSGRYNAFVLDYGPVSRAPCFVHVVHNINYVSFCIASYISAFERTGMPGNSVICIGHSIGAHVCGRLKKNLRFRLQKIIGEWRSFRFMRTSETGSCDFSQGLDPALPLIREGERLSYKDAERVHTISTNAGFYGDVGSIGHVDVCVNNGNVQPFCADEISNASVFGNEFICLFILMNGTHVFCLLDANLCSHLWALCFAAQSLFNDYQMHAKKCTQVCPHLSLFQFANKFTPLDRRSDASFSNNVIEANNRPDSIAWGLDIPTRSVNHSQPMQMKD